MIFYLCSMPFLYLVIVRNGLPFGKPKWGHLFDSNDNSVINDWALLSTTRVRLGGMTNAIFSHHVSSPRVQCPWSSLVLSFWMCMTLFNQITLIFISSCQHQCILNCINYKDMHNLKWYLTYRQCGRHVNLE